MLSQLNQQKKVVGVKQSYKVIRNGQTACVFVAQDAEMRVLRPIYELCEQMQVPVHEVDSMQTLGKAAQINIGAAVVAVLK